MIKNLNFYFFLIHFAIIIVFTITFIITINSAIEIFNFIIFSVITTIMIINLDYVDIIVAKSHLKSSLANYYYYYFYFFIFHLKLIQHFYFKIALINP